MRKRTRIILRSRHGILPTTPGRVYPRQTPGLLGLDHGPGLVDLAERFRGVFGAADVVGCFFGVYAGYAARYTGVGGLPDGYFGAEVGGCCCCVIFGVDESWGG